MNTDSRRGLTRPLSIAPMMDYTDRHFRAVLRSFTRETLIYSEMIHTSALVLGGRLELIHFSPCEHPIALQLGGDSPKALAQAARYAEELGWDEVNLNVGCPSDRVQKGRFGACLMAYPEIVAEAVSEMRAAVKIPVTVKHRIGIDELDSFEYMLRFVDTVRAAGCDRFSVHARKAWLKGLSPKENRTIPPIRYEEVWRLKRERPELVIEVNGQIKTMQEALIQLEHVDAVMIGRAAYENPYVFAQADQLIFGHTDRPILSRGDIASGILPYLSDVVNQGVKAHHVTRHLLGLFHGTRVSRAWKQGLAEVGTMGREAPKGLESLIARLSDHAEPVLDR